MKPESIFIETKTLEGRDGKFYSKVVFHIGVQTFVIDYDVGDSRSVEWVAGQLKSALENAGCHRVLMSTLIDRSNTKDKAPADHEASRSSWKRTPNAEGWWIAWDGQYPSLHFVSPLKHRDGLHVYLRSNWRHVETLGNDFECWQPVTVPSYFDGLNVKDHASDCSTRYCEACREPFSELSKELQGELRKLFEDVKTCAKCCQQKLKEAYERTMVD